MPHTRGRASERCPENGRRARAFPRERMRESGRRLDAHNRRSVPRVANTAVPSSCAVGRGGDATRTRVRTPVRGCEKTLSKHCATSPPFHESMTKMLCKSKHKQPPPSHSFFSGRATCIPVRARRSSEHASYPHPHLCQWMLGWRPAILHFIQRLAFCKVVGVKVSEFWFDEAVVQSFCTRRSCCKAFQP